MRRPLLIVALALAFAFAGCDSGTSDPGGGSGGSGGALPSGGSGGGGDGGTGGTGGGGKGGEEESPKEVRCGDSRIIELAGLASGTASVSDTLDREDGWIGLCTEPESYGYDAVVHFRAAVSGYHSFAVEGDFVAVVYALTDCNDGFTELFCKIGDGSKNPSFTEYVEKGEDLFIVVDSLTETQKNFTLTASPIDVTAPTLSSLEAFANRSTKFTGWRATGQNPDSPIIEIKMELFDGDDVRIFSEQMPLEAVNWLSVTQQGGNFDAVASFSLGDRAPAVGKVGLQLIGENGIPTELVFAKTTNPPKVDRGEACDPNMAWGTCRDVDVCTQSGEQWFCVAR